MLSFIGYCVLGGITSALVDRIFPQLTTCEERVGFLIAAGILWPLTLGGLLAYAAFYLVKRGLGENK